MDYKELYSMLNRTWAHALIDERVLWHVEFSGMDLRPEVQRAIRRAEGYLAAVAEALSDIVAAGPDGLRGGQA
jgi:hypothetical protein